VIDINYTLTSQYIKELFEIYSNEYVCVSIYDDFQLLQENFEEMFSSYVPNESINADFDVYVSFIIGLASGGIKSKLEDALERYKIKIKLNKSFYEWFPKYRFLERYDLSEYENLYNTKNITEKLRGKLLETIKVRENH